jgi:hypothetical protein
MTKQSKPTATDLLMAGLAVTPIMLLGGWVPLSIAAVCHVTAQGVLLPFRVYDKLTEKDTPPS